MTSRPMQPLQLDSLQWDTTSMYYDFYHLKQNPFDEVPDPEFLYLSRSHKTVLHALIRGFEEQQGLMVIFGNTGLGKTTLLRAMQERIEQQHGQTIFLSCPKGSFDAVLSRICQECGLADTSTDPQTQLTQLQQTLLQGRQNGWQVVLFIDEIHRLPVPTLASILELSAWQTPQGEPLLPMVCAGLPAVQRTLKLPQLRPLQKCLGVQETLTPLTAKESLGYIRHRLTRVLVPEDALFTARTVKRVVRIARGNPRVLNTLCTNLLATGAVRRQKPVSTDTAREVLADWQETYSRLPEVRWGRTVTAGLLFGAGLWWGWQVVWMAGMPQLLLERLPLRSAAPRPGVTAPEVSPHVVRALEAQAKPEDTHSTPDRHDYPSPSPVPDTGFPESQPAPGQPLLPLPDSGEALAPLPTQEVRVPGEKPSRQISLTTTPAIAAHSKRHTVHFHSTPEAATVSINGKVIGRTPVAVDLQLGSHRILVEKKGHTSNNYMLQLERVGASSLYDDLQIDDRAR